MKTRHMEKIRLSIFLSILAIVLLCAPAAWSDTTVGGTISTDTTWTQAGSPYIVTYSITVQGTDGADGITTLTIEPGVEVRFNMSMYMVIGGGSGAPGALMAQGTAADPVVFTSNQPSPAPGNWSSIQFYTTADPSSTLDHCVVEYAGSVYQTSILVYGASPNISNTTIKDSSGYDLYYMNYGPVGGTVSGCTFNSGVYIAAANCSASFSNNTFNHNSAFPCRVKADDVQRLVNNNNVFNNPEQSHLLVSGGNITKDATWTSAVPIAFIYDTSVQGTDGADGVTTLTLDPGAKLKFESGKYLKVGGSYGAPGALMAQGTAADPVVFTSNQPSPAPGNWSSIQFYTTADPSSTLDHCIVEYAGSVYQTSILVYGASPNISNTTIKDSSGYDLYYMNYGPVGGTVSGCTFNSGVYIAAVNSSASFSDNTFNHNSAFPSKVYADDVQQLVNNNNVFNNPEQSHLLVSGGNITKDATWTAAVPISFSTYTVIQGTDGTDGVTTLTLEAGAKLKFGNHHYMQIGANWGSPGALVAQGTAENPINFTSNMQTPASGDWTGLKFLASNDTSSRLAYCRVAYAGMSNQPSVYVYQTSASIINTTFENNFNYDLSYSGIVGGTLTGCTLSNGMHLASTSNSVDITGNTFNQNNAFPIKAYADDIHNLISSNTFANVDDASYLEVIGGNVTKDATWTADIPIHLSSNLKIQGVDGDDGITTLTLTPGAKIVFSQFRFLDISSNWGEPGALFAQGTTDNRIVFTSNQPSPAPGNWGGLRFWNHTSDNASSLKYCIVEYGGSVELHNAKPTIEDSILRYSSSSGIFANGSGSSGVQISCNTIANNTNGIYCYNEAQPVIESNNFTGNTQYAIYSNNQAQISAENNWWNDAAGPNQGGDGYYGNVDADPWSVEANNCIPVQPNHPPDMPGSPTPADNAVRVPLSSGTLTLQWVGSDPDTQDTVAYDLYWGTSADTLSIIAPDIVGNQRQMTGLSEGITYFWRITAKDNHGATTPGPVWRFTTNGGDPDLVVAGLTCDPAGNIQPGQSVTLTATIQNNGAGPAVDTFSVDLTVDSLSLGQKTIDSIIPAGTGIQLTWTWTYNSGDPALVLLADDQSQVVESSEQNNQYAATLYQVADMTPPAWVSGAPDQGALLQQIQQITFTLTDSQSAIDDAAVTAGFTLRHSNQQTVTGTVSEANDTFTFIPNSLPLADGAYQASVTAADAHGNSQVHTLDFTIDATAPPKPVITGGTVTSGVIQARPHPNSADQFVVELTGTREAGTSVWLNGVQRVGLGDTDWSMQVVLRPGDNALEVRLVDRAGNQGDPEWVDIQVSTSNAAHYEYDNAGRTRTIHSNQQ